MSKYRQDFDEDGDKSGWSEDREGAFGNDYEQHYDSDDNKAGYSEERTGIFGDEYTQHHDNDSDKAGYSEEKTGIFGDKYTQHYDSEGNKSGYSEERTGIFGDKYTQHYDDDGGKSGHSEEKDSACFITTACVESAGLGDDCHELTTLRRFREKYIRPRANGPELIDEYYQTAPSVVRAINRRPDASKLYAGIFEQMILPCVALVESGEYEAALSLYHDSFTGLRSTLLQ